MSSQHKCTIVIPIHCINDDNVTFENFFEPASLDLSVDCSRIGLPSIPVQTRYFPIPEAPIFDIVNAHIGTPIVSYDDELFRYIEYQFSCPEGYAYSWLEFSSILSIPDKIWTKEYDEDHEFYDLFAIDSFSTHYGLIDGREFGMSSKISFPAKQYFCEIFFNLICGLITSTNIAYRGSIETRFAILSTTDWIDDEYYGLPNTQAFVLSGLYSEYISPTLYQEYPALCWPDFTRLPLRDVWRWARSIPGFVDSSLSISNIGRALNSFCFLFKPLHQGEKLLYSVMGLEAVYTSREAGKGAQLRQNIPRLIDVDRLLKGKDYKKILKKIYGQRSAFIHGGKNLPNPFRPSLYSPKDVSEHDMDLWEARTYAFILLVESLRRVSLLNYKEIVFEQSE
jgi:hypothetical protein